MNSKETIKDSEVNLKNILLGKDPFSIINKVFNHNEIKHIENA